MQGSGLCQIPSQPGLRAVFVFMTNADAAENSLAMLPPMGYNTWNDLECEPSVEKLKNIVTKLKELKFDELGYKYITVDDCWMSRKRTKQGEFEPEPKFFPNGMTEFGKFVHANDFYFGIYTDRGQATCTGRPGSEGFEEIDAKTFASWEVDFVKNDGCWDPDCGSWMDGFPQSGSCSESGRTMAVEKYHRMKTALEKTGRKIVHAVCGWQPWFAPVGRQIGQMWRISADVKNWPGVYEAMRIMEQLGQYHGPGGWNDPDMLIGSSPGAARILTPLQARAQFSLWALHSAPLFLGGSILKMSDYDLATYSNAEVIAINQDLAGRPARLVTTNCPPYVQFNMSIKGNYTPVFQVIGKEELLRSVSCGAHRAPSCGECPQGHGAEWCNGACKWDKKNSKCIPSRKQMRFEDEPGPWTMDYYKEPSQMECHQIWSKELSTGEVAVGVINYGRARQNVTLDVIALNLTWSGNVSATEIWTKNISLFTSTMEINLEPLGGHKLYRLSCVKCEKMNDGGKDKIPIPQGFLDEIHGESTLGMGDATEFVLESTNEIMNQYPFVWNLVCVAMLLLLIFFSRTIQNRCANCIRRTASAQLR